MTDAMDQVFFEEAYNELEKTVQRLEAGELDLQEAINLYERGMRLARHCADLLDAAELQIQELAVTQDLPQAGMFPDEVER